MGRWEDDSRSGKEREHLNIVREDMREIKRRKLEVEIYNGSENVSLVTFNKNYKKNIQKEPIEYTWKLCSLL